ncbi:LysR family transcriptional regulator [Hyphomicrobium sp. 1Nfss2.1]|uniref:LysR family transcriptional regulator n=1 Tax=Hyphomicrobium sp. 1Nfss2.1 TaxID=3413936 RepID=UPI003C7AB238
MNLQQLRYVRALYEEGSFVAAAARCAVTQPTLSNGIAQLEAELGHRIFHRTTRSVSLTHFGQQLLPGVLETLNSYDRLRDMVRKLDNPAMTLHVGISPLVGIKLAEALLEPFRQGRPDVGVIYREGNLSTLCDDLKREQLDLVIAPFDKRSIPAGDYLLQSLCSEPLLFLPRSEEKDRWHGVNQVEVETIAGEEFVLVPNACGLAQVTKGLFDDQRLTLHRYPGEASSYAAVQEWTQIGLGCGILPESKVNSEGRKRAITILRDGEPVNISYFALGKPNTVPPTVLDELWEMLGPGREGLPCPRVAAAAE